MRCHGCSVVLLLVEALTIVARLWFVAVFVEWKMKKGLWWKVERKEQ